MDKVMVVCSPLEDNATLGLEVKCVGCHDKIWLSDSSVKTIKDAHPDDFEQEKIDPMCIDCVVKQMGESKDEDFSFLGMGKEQMEELKDNVDPEHLKLLQSMNEKLKNNPVSALKDLVRGECPFDVGDVVVSSSRTPAGELVEDETKFIVVKDNDGDFCIISPVTKQAYDVKVWGLFRKIGTMNME